MKADDRAAALAAVYAQLPAMQCQGLCSDSCYSLGMTRVEQANIAATTGVRLGLTHANTRCAALTILNQCSVYEARPAICRLWGMTAGMRCQYGCEPEGGFLSAAQTYEILAQVAEVDGDLEQAAAFRAPFADEQDAARAEKVMLGLQRERDLAYERRAARSNAVFVVGPNRISKNRPRGGRW